MPLKIMLLKNMLLEIMLLSEAMNAEIWKKWWNRFNE